jgi:hypothetical protein
MGTARAPPFDQGKTLETRSSNNGEQSAEQLAGVLNPGK